jgi:hypothetical protein
METSPQQLVLKYLMALGLLVVAHMLHTNG